MLALRYGALNMIVVMDYRDLRCAGNLRRGGRHYERSECCLGTANPFEDEDHCPKEQGQ
jgi:hypothetical protein